MYTFSRTVRDIESEVHTRTCVVKWVFPGLMPRVHKFHGSAHLVQGSGLPGILCPLSGSYLSYHRKEVKYHSLRQGLCETVNNKEKVLQDGGPLPGPESGLLSNTRNELSKETRADIAGDVTGKGAQVTAAGWGTPGGRLCTRLAVLGLRWGDSRLSVGDHSDSGSFLVVHAPLNQHGFQQGGFWESVGYGVSPSDFSQIPPVGDWLASSVFLTSIPCHKITHADGYYGAWPGWLVSVSVYPQRKGTEPAGQRIQNGSIRKES